MRRSPFVICFQPLSLLAGVLLLSGCAKSHEFETAKVSGMVTYNAKPLQIGSLLFIPEAGGPTAQGKINTKGEFYMGTYNDADGAILGKHKVMIMAITSPGGTGLPEDSIKSKGDGVPVSVIPEHFGDQSKSGLEVEVKKGENRLTFELSDTTGKVVVGE